MPVIDIRRAAPISSLRPGARCAWRRVRSVEPASVAVAMTPVSNGRPRYVGNVRELAKEVRWNAMRVVQNDERVAPAWAMVDATF
jgi:hypothetical protein